MFTMRLSDELGEQLRAAASAAGVPKSQLVARMLQRELGGRAGGQKPLAARPDGRRKQVFVAIGNDELAAIDAAADALDMTRNQWIAARAKGGVSPDKAGSMLSLQTRRQIRAVFDQVRRLGVNINQAVRVVNAAAMPKSGMDLAMAADNLTRMNDEVRTQIKETESVLLAAIKTESDHWQA